MTPHTGTAMARKPTTNITLRPDPLRGEHAGEAQLREPQPVGIQVGEDEERHDERRDHRQCVMETIRRERFGGVAWFGTEVVVTPSS